jgi:hypothetical protein
MAALKLAMIGAPWPALANCPSERMERSEGNRPDAGRSPNQLAY